MSPAPDARRQSVLATHTERGLLLVVDLVDDLLELETNVYDRAALIALRVRAATLLAGARQADTEELRRDPTRPPWLRRPES